MWLQTPATPVDLKQDRNGMKRPLTQHVPLSPTQGSYGEGEGADTGAVAYLQN